MSILILTSLWHGPTDFCLFQKLPSLNGVATAFFLPLLPVSVPTCSSYLSSSLAMASILEFFRVLSSALLSSQSTHSSVQLELTYLESD